MSGILFGFVLDILILGCLATVIYYTIRLSKSLDNFKTHKAEMKSLIADLTKNIDHAQAAIDGLKLTGDNAGRDLQDMINDARMSFDELQIMNEAGNNLATRLENLATRTGSSETKTAKPSAPLSRVLDLPREPDDSSIFSIQDRDFEESAAPSLDNEAEWGDEEQVPDDLQSQAEQELFRALQKNQRQKSSGRQH